MLPSGLSRQYSSTLSSIMRLVDILAVAAGGWLAFGLRFGEGSLYPNYQIAVLLATLLTLAVFSRFGMYHSWRGKSRLFQLRMLTVSWLTVLLILIVIAFMTKTSATFSRQWLATWAITTWGFLFLFRLALAQMLRIMRQQGWNHRRIVIVGAGNLGRDVARRIQEAAWTGLDIVAFIDDDEKLCGTHIDGIKVKCGIPELRALIQTEDIDEVWLALPFPAEHRIKEILHDLRHSTLTIRFVPDIFGFRLINHSVAEIAGLPILNLTESPMRGMNRFIKALEDKTLALIILIITAPLMVWCAIGVKRSSPGPIFYRQERVSWNGTPFQMLKFRSMPVEVEKKTGAVWAKPGENRATEFGALLRRTSLDELPQFINVLKGDMSIVGPRPERPVFVEKFKDEIPLYMQKHLVKAGITGWAQINGWRGDTDLNKRIEYDLYYIEHWSLWFDLKIIVLTIAKIFTDKNAY
ncbi:MAG TPA: undecaprenyl-phosphate glucose phosphotransferase [Gammaproteobacteria bacterium]|nr:undecaprenyl-phosphate glucose phosphotransferase [Gammaproteobacteria bacterium]